AGASVSAVGRRPILAMDRFLLQEGSFLPVRAPAMAGEPRFSPVWASFLPTHASLGEGRARFSPEREPVLPSASSSSAQRPRFRSRRRLRAGPPSTLAAVGAPGWRESWRGREARGRAGHTEEELLRPAREVVGCPRTVLSEFKVQGFKAVFDARMSS